MAFSLQAKMSLAEKVGELERNRVVPVRVIREVGGNYTVTGGSGEDWILTLWYAFMYVYVTGAWSRTISHWVLLGCLGKMKNGLGTTEGVTYCASLQELFLKRQ